MYVASVWVVLPTTKTSNKGSRSRFEGPHRGKNSRWHGLFLNKDLKYSCLGGVLDNNYTRISVSSYRATSGDIAVSSEEKVYNVVLKQAALVKEQLRPSTPRGLGVNPTTWNLLSKSYDRCGQVCAEYAKTFYLGTLLMNPERRKAIWAIYVWCRRTDELVDGPNASQMTPMALDRWESRLEDIFSGRPYDIFDAALSDTVVKFPLDIQPFKDMIKGMRMDLEKSRYKNFDELYLYCYYVAGTVGLMSVPVMGISPESQANTKSVYNGAVALGLANQLTNILRDVGEE